MKLWLLKAREDLIGDNNPWDPWYDKAYGFVIRAFNERRARQLADGNGSDENGAIKGVKPWLDAKYSTCEELLPDGEPGELLRDFHSA